MSSPKISLIVCTRNRASQLVDHLNAIEAIRHPSWEYVVVNNGSTDGTQQVLEDFAARFDGKIRLVFEPRRGLSNARNAGLRAASANLIAFTDDDCYPQPDFLTAVETVFGEDPNLAYLGGLVRLHDPSDYPTTIHRFTHREDYPPHSFLWAGGVKGANMAFRRGVLDAVNGFDVRLGPGTRFCIDDTEFVGRLSAQGFAGAFDPRPVIAHHHRRKAAEAAILMAQYDRGRGVHYLLGLTRPTVRSQYLRQWYWAMQREPWPKTFRELYGAAEFLARYWLSLNAPRWTEIGPENVDLAPVTE